VLSTKAGHPVVTGVDDWGLGRGAKAMTLAPPGAALVWKPKNKRATSRNLKDIETAGVDSGLILVPPRLSSEASKGHFEAIS